MSPSRAQRGGNRQGSIVAEAVPFSPSSSVLQQGVWRHHCEERQADFLWRLVLWRVGVWVYRETVEKWRREGLRLEEVLSEAAEGQDFRGRIWMAYCGDGAREGGRIQRAC